MQEDDGLDEFLDAVRDSCRNHATRKGYMGAGGNVLGGMTLMLGVAQDHAIGEILAKVVEFKRTPRRVLAVKCAGWSHRLWLTVKDDPDSK